MLLAEARCSCALLVEQDGRREHLVFDDLGCLLDYRSHHPRTVVVGTFVHDFATGTWVPGDAAYYLFGISDTRSTPMASGIVAFETERMAREKQTLSGGEIMNHERLVEARRGSREAWRSPATGAP
jgi:hypothetical protein